MNTQVSNSTDFAPQKERFLQGGIEPGQTVPKYLCHIDMATNVCSVTLVKSRPEQSCPFAAFFIQMTDSPDLLLGGERAGRYMQ